jgi:ribosome-associated protein
MARITKAELDLAVNAPSKTKLKEAMLELQNLGKILGELPDNQFAALTMDDDLRDALTEYRRLTNFEARRRQMQYIGKLLRDIDTGTFRSAIETHKAGLARNTDSLHEAEQWRERLLADDAALTEWIAAHPGGDSRQLRALIRDSRRDLERAAATGTAKGKVHAYRELFKKLRDILRTAPTAD